MIIDRRKRCAFLLIFTFSLVAVCLLAVGLGTDFWVVAYPRRIVDQNITDASRNFSEEEKATKFQGYVNIGLFRGSKKLDHGFGVRVTNVTTPLAWSDDVMLFNFGLWVSTVVFVAVAMVWGLVSAGFAMLNAATRPIATINGPAGLYLWNAMAAVFSLTATVIYVVLFYKHFAENVLERRDVENRWTSRGRASFHFSFYFTPLATLLWVLNILCLAVANCQYPRSYKGTMKTKTPDHGVMMY